MYVKEIMKTFDQEPISTNVVNIAINGQELPQWVTRSETPQELIDQGWNSGRQEKYFKPPETLEEVATYQLRYSIWAQQWEGEK